jgi:glutaredoxin
MNTISKVLVLFFLLSSNLWAVSVKTPWYTLSTDKKATINVELFFSSTCPHCHHADAFFNKIRAQSSDLNIKRYMINEDKEALFRFNQLLSYQRMDDFSVPSIFFCDSRWVGFASAETTGKDLMRAINYCKQEIEKNGTLTQATINTLRHWANANKFNSGMVGNPSVFNYILTIAITDAFAPCAFFCFFAFLALLFIEENWTKKITAGLLFILAVAIIHYVQQEYTSSFYKILPWLRIPAALVGLLALYFVIQHSKKQVHGALYFSLAFLFGLLVTSYQQTCVMNWAYIFQQWLNNQHILPVQRGFYQLLYQIVYGLPLLFILILYFLIMKIKFIAARQARLLSIGLLFIVAIALCLIVYPILLSHLTLSLIVMFIVVICSRFLNST